MRRFLKSSTNLRTIVVAVVVAMVAGSTGAIASQLITSKDIQNGTIRPADLNKKLLKKINSGGKLAAAIPGQSGTNGTNGATGTKGATGANGATGADAEFSAGNWSVIDRNTIGSPVAAFRPGPTVPGAHGQPPFGEGSLGLETADSTEKVSFGNQVDFAGDPVSGLTAIGFYAFVTGEDFGYGEPEPNITLEINPQVSGAHYSSMVFVPANSTLRANEWSDYIDGTASVTNRGSEGWYFTNGATATATGCSQGISAPSRKRRPALRPTKSDDARQHPHDCCGQGSR